MKRRQFLQFSVIGCFAPLSLVEYKSKARQLAEAMLLSFESSRKFTKRKHKIEVFIDPSIYRSRLDGLYCWSVDREYLRNLQNNPEQIDFSNTDCGQSCAGSVEWRMIDRVSHMEVYYEFKILCDERGYSCEFCDTENLAKYSKLSQDCDQPPPPNVFPWYTEVY